MSPRKGTSLKILFVSTEAVPYAQVGGLGEVISALPKSLRAMGHDARVFMPKYLSISRKRYKFTPVMEGLQLGKPANDPHNLTVSNVLRHRKADGATTYFLENMEFYEKRANVYGYADDTARWLLLCRGVLEFLRRSEWTPDVIIANDWPAGFLPNLMETEYRNDPVLSRIATVYMIHNLKNQGMFDVHFVADSNYDWGTSPLPDIFDIAKVKLLNGMRRGIIYADTIGVVSPTYAKEILEPELGERLNDLLNKRKDRLVGILNGIDYKKYNPATDRGITRKYSNKRLSGRAENKRALQRIFKLPQRRDAFLMGFVGRLDEQKGIKLFMNVAKPVLENLDIQFVLVGTGDKDYRMFFKELEEEYPEQVSTHLFFSQKLPKRIFAGADALLMPSRFEPAGLVQMEAMHYGCVPVVRNTGGLADTVKDDTVGNPGTGFVFGDYEAMAMLIAIVRAAAAFRDKRRWDGIVRRAMREDFSWDASASAHARLYRQAIRHHKK
ncbi:MAG TPA: glycogen/starch synthase [Candidatus Paceibacterota bacterium]|nr:glycogen/starch synthase [Candidatus Paceibacterota bacterium]